VSLEAAGGERPAVLHGRVIRGSWGGPDKTILNSARFLEPAYRLICVYLRDPRDPAFADLESLARRCGATIAAVDDRGAWDLGVVQTVRRLSELHQARIWHGHDYKSNLLGLLLARRRSPPVSLVSTVHGWVKRTHRTPLYYALDRWSLRHYDRVLCVSEDIRDRCLKAGVRPERCRFLPNAVDTTQFRRRRSVEDAKRARGVSPETLVIGAIGRLSAEKGFDLLLRAFARAFSGVPAQLWIAGRGEEHERLVDLAAQLGVGDRVRMLGFCADTVELFEAFDLFVLSSVREGMPNVVLEAMAMEVPVLATPVAGIPRVISHGDSGWLVAPGDTEALAQGLTLLSEDGELRRRLASAGRRLVSDRYTFQRRMEAVRSLYAEVLGEAKKRSSGQRTYTRES